MEVEYEITVDDIIAFNILFQKSSRTMSRMRWWIWIGPLLFVAITGLSVLGSEEPLEALVARAPLALVFVAIVAYFVLARRRSVEKIVTRLLEESSGCDMLGHRRLSMDDDGFRETSDFIESYVRWPAVERIAATDDHVFLYTSAMSAYIVPARAFPDEAAFRAFVDAARRLQQVAHGTAPDEADGEKDD